MFLLCVMTVFSRQEDKTYNPSLGDLQPAEAETGVCNVTVTGAVFSAFRRLFLLLPPV